MAGPAPDSRGRLVLTRRVGDSIIIRIPPEPQADGSPSLSEPLEIEIYLSAIPSSSRARLSITAPASVRVHRAERISKNGSKPDHPEHGSHADPRS